MIPIEGAHSFGCRVWACAGLTVYCVLSDLTVTNGRKLRNLKASESECKYCQCPRSSQLATRGPHCPLCCPFHQSGPSSPCRCNPLTLVTPLFWRPAAALSCSNHLMDITCRDNVSWEPDSWPLEVSWQEPDALDPLTMEALYHPLSCDPRAAATNPGKFSAAPCAPSAPSESGPSGGPLPPLLQVIMARTHQLVSSAFSGYTQKCYMHPLPFLPT